jgi:hypothetical protein
MTAGFQMGDLRLCLWLGSLFYEIFPTGGTDLALSAAGNYRMLRARGITVRTTLDCLIATFCLQNGHTLLHNDRDFEPFEAVLGLRVIRNMS